MKACELNCSGSLQEYFPSSLRGTSFCETWGSLPCRPGCDPVPHCAHQCITNNEMQLREDIINTKFNIHTKHKAASMLPCAPHFQLTHLQWSLLARLLICHEGSCSVPLLFPSFGQPSKPACPHTPYDSCFPPTTVTFSPRMWAPSWNKTELCSFFYRCQADDCYSTCNAPVAAWVFSTWDTSSRVGVGAEGAAGRRGRMGFQRDAHSEAGLRHLPQGFCSEHLWGSDAAVSLSHLKVDWPQTPSSHPWMELTCGQSTHLEPQLEGVPGFSSWMWSQQPSQPSTAASKTLGHTLGRWWGRFSPPVPPGDIQAQLSWVHWQPWNPFMAKSLGLIYSVIRGSLTPPKFCSTRSKLTSLKEHWVEEVPTQGEHTGASYALSCEGSFPLLSKVEWTTCKIHKGLAYLIGFRMSKCGISQNCYSYTKNKTMDWSTVEGWFITVPFY